MPTLVLYVVRRMHVRFCNGSYLGGADGACVKCGAWNGSGTRRAPCHEYNRRRQTVRRLGRQRGGVLQSRAGSDCRIQPACCTLHPAPPPVPQEVSLKRLRPCNSLTHPTQGCLQTKLSGFKHAAKTMAWNSCVLLVKKLECISLPLVVL